MQQTALNLIAIGVFIMTLTCLLGPILNISPTIPAVATLGIMGLATIDTLSLQNRGATLLLDVFSSKQHRERVIHHEAGHFLAAYFLSIPIAGYTLTAWEAFKQKQAGFGGVIFDTDVFSRQIDPKEMPLIVERLATVWMAGIAAETLIYGNVEGAQDDLQTLRTILNSSGIPKQQFSQKENWAKLQASNLIKKYNKSYDALVEAMTARATLEECYKVIQQHLDFSAE
ncbi:MAG: ATP-dependent Zn protease [Xenococcaceae cyanobacterium]